MAKVHFVIHHVDYGTTMAQAKIAADAGADGLFVISHKGQDEDVVEMACELKGITNRRAEAMDIGVNLLGTDPHDAVLIVIARKIPMLWADGCGITGKGVGNAGLAMFDALSGAPGHKRVRVFAGVAFKHQAPERNPPIAARNAKILGFVPTTSGEATGLAPEVEKIAAMSKAVGGGLAIASGMTPENVWQFAPYLSDILVATGVSRDFHHFDEAKSKAFVKAVSRVRSDIAESRNQARNAASPIKRT